MRKLGLFLSVIGAVGLLFTAISFASDYQPMCIRVVKRLPEQNKFTRDEVTTAVIQQIENTRAHFYFGVFCSAVQVAGAVCLWRTKSGAQ